MGLESLLAMVMKCLETKAKIRQIIIIIIIVFFFFFFFAISRAAAMACGGSQARGPIRAVAVSLHQGHSNAGSKLHL